MTSLKRNHRVLPLLAAMILALGADAQETKAKHYETPEAAAEAMAKACETNDVAALLAMVGSEHKDVVDPAGDPGVEARRRDFAEQLREAHGFEANGADRKTLVVGDDKWPFPIPLVKDAGGWFWDASAGREELLDRLIGENEFQAISICRGYVDAQMDYAAADRDGDEVLEYAQRIRSTPGQRDGLYWPVDPASGERPSPIGELVTEAGLKPKAESDGKPHWGYYFRILHRQGGNVPGGKYDYVINGNMIAGFGLLAYPADYGSSGVMTFVVNHQGKIHQKDLGEKTAEIASEIDAYDPDATWTWVQEVEDLLE